MRFLAALVAISAISGLAGASLYTSAPYSSFADSPLFSLSGVALDDFESSTRTAGYSMSAGSILGPGSLTDSVDGDDGSVDGSGAGGRSWYSSNQSTIVINFDQVSGFYPTHVGAVWTDIGFDKNGVASGYGDLSFEAFDENGASLGVYGPFGVGDGRFDGTSADDIFLGATNTSGISRMAIYADSGDWELDHVQFATVPDPATMTAMAFGVAGYLGRRRKK